MNRGLAIVAGALVLGGCGGDGAPAGPALEQTAAKLEQIESGILSVSVRMEPRNGEAFGYDLAGPVRLARDGELPVADVEYTQLANGQEDTVRLVLDEDGGGFVERDGTKTELSEAQVEELRSSGTLLGEEGLGTLGFEQWISDPQLSDGPEGTDKVTAELDVAAAMAGLAALSGVLQQDVQLSAEQRRQVADTVEESSFELLTGADDRLLRKLALSFTLGTDVPEELREAIGDDAVGASFSFDLELDEVNEPVEIG